VVDALPATWTRSSPCPAVPSAATGPCSGPPARVAARRRARRHGGSRAGVTELVEAAVRCAEFEGQRYCLGFGWTDRTEAKVRERLAAGLTGRRTRTESTVETTGDLDALATLSRLASTPPEARVVAERDELTEAARSVAKVWLIRHQIQEVPLPDGFLEDHPEARAD